MGDEQWNLEKYARWTLNSGKPDLPENHQWTTHSGEGIFIVLTKEHHLVVKEGAVILENHALWNAQAWMKAIARGDSMLFLIRLQNEARKFRIQFSSIAKPGAMVCQEFVSKVKSYFPIKIDSSKTTNVTVEAAAANDCNVTGENMQSKNGTGCLNDCPRLPLSSENNCEDITAANPIGRLAEVLRERGPLALPLAYQNINLPDFDMDMAVRLCLTDSNFPAFVCQVEQCLKNIVAESASACDNGGDMMTATNHPPR